MARKPQDTSAEEPDGGNLHVRFRGGPGRGNRPGLLNADRVRAQALEVAHPNAVEYARVSSVRVRPLRAAAEGGGSVRR